MHDQPPVVKTNMFKTINPFTRHPWLHAGRGYWSHMLFAVKISARIGLSCLIFLVHAIFPFIPIPKVLNIDKLSQFLENMNQSVKKNK